MIVGQPQSVPLSSALALREQAHRRATVVAIALLLVLGTSPVYIHHLFALVGERLLAGVDHLGALCLTALHLLLVPVHRLFHIVVLAGLAYAIWDRIRAWRALRSTLSLLSARAPATGDAFWNAAIVAGVDPRRLRVVTGLPNPAFTAGLIFPRLYLAAGLAGRLTPDQLVAVIAHEGAHAARRDPLRLFLLRLLGCTIFWIPALRRLEDDVRDEAEILADNAASRGRPLVLASAILALAEWGKEQSVPVLTLGFQRDELLDRRIRRLAGEAAPIRSHVTRSSVVAAALALSVVWGSGVVMAHPMPAAESHAEAASSHHCSHQGESALGHLFCLGSPLSRSLRHDCPHNAG